MLGEHEKALENYMGALHMRQSLFKSDHPDVAASLNNVGVTFTHQGKHGEALDFYQRALYMRRNLFDDDHPDVAASLNNMGIAYTKLGMYE